MILQVSEQWTKKVYAEFFMQGDRNTTNVNKPMVGFITFAAAPTIEALVNIVPKFRIIVIIVRVI